MKVNQMIKTAFPLLAAALLASLCHRKQRKGRRHHRCRPVWPEAYLRYLRINIAAPCPRKPNQAAIEAGMTEDRAL